MTDKYNKGTLVRCSAHFTDIDGDDADPTTVVFKFKGPDDEEVTTYTYPDDNEIVVKDSVGHYHSDVLGDYKGDWVYYFQGTGAVQIADEGSFRIVEGRLG
jgi:hypothetical protein